MKAAPLVMASMLDYERFHGMLIGPAAARQCARSFDRGCILFMSSGYDDARLEKYEVKPPLTLFTYYCLVLWSFTGLSALLKLRTTRDVREGQDLSVADGPKQLRMTPRVLDFVKKAGASVHMPRIIRRFEFRFWIPGLHVAMYHLLTTAEDGSQALHLVEVYEAFNWSKMGEEAEQKAS
eukprot:TRINITY_DN50387_c0_g1_i1.p1 TRINITY_DN50387_c0_g1~~TRINITY_DN50387_c0_g1_i1.p1  ORF type:complete len:180 (-),score=27.05 TRINITY_DN50387_c0_g1_i1:387-926(-)